MNKLEIIFRLNIDEKIVIEAIDSIKDISPCCYEVPFVFIGKSNRWILWKDFINVGVQELSYYLEKALANQLTLHESLNDDIGFMWNEEAQGKPGFVYREIGKNYKQWIGLSYALWSSNTQAWVYNNRDGQIIFEITPCYPWQFRELNNNDEKIIPYEEWIKSYKPLLIRVIPKKIAENWLKKCHKILNQLDYSAKCLSAKNESDLS